MPAAEAGGSFRSAPLADRSMTRVSTGHDCLADACIENAGCRADVAGNAIAVEIRKDSGRPADRIGGEAGIIGGNQE
ncbi:MAG: hypothetical protein V4673_05455, partial [Pseudomonadota bacterium]